MHWNESHDSPFEPIQEEYTFEETQDKPTLDENDFLKMINLQERYNYFKSLIKLQRLNNINEENSQNHALKVMLQLIQYYAQCISQASANIENIVMYFQQKIKDLNAHYKNIVDLQSKSTVLTRINTPQSELGNIEHSFKLINIEEHLQLSNEQEAESVHSSKKQYNKTLMVAIQSQNIEEAINQSYKKADFMKKSISRSIQNQEESLENRIRSKKNKLINLKSNHTPESVTTAATASGCKIGKKVRRKKQYSASFHTISNNLTESGSESELDEAESLYISQFNIEQQCGRS